MTTRVLKFVAGGAIAAILGACTALTIAPKPIVATQPSLDGNTADSGVLGQLSDGGYVLSTGAITRYEDLIARGYGKPFVPPVERGSGYHPIPEGSYPVKEADGKIHQEAIHAGSFEMDAQHVSLFAQMILASHLPTKA